jgi:Ca-activated chloride channel family protein
MRVLLAVFVLVLGISQGRQLHQARQEEQQPQCEQETSWDFSVCIIDTGEQPVISRGGNARVAPLLGLSHGAAIPTAGSATAEIGFRTGGAQDIENFRENINNGYLPLPTDVSFGGVVKDYYFDTTASSSTGITATTSCTDLFCPVYSAASTVDPLLVTAYEGPSGSGLSNQLYLAVGLETGLKAEDVQRKPLNLVLLVDYSGSMSSTFDAYYYDTFGNRQNLTAKGTASFHIFIYFLLPALSLSVLILFSLTFRIPLKTMISTAETSKSKMDVAKEVLNGVLDQLHPSDRVSIVLFDDSACTPMLLQSVSCLSLGQLKNSILRDVQPDGGTNQEAGLEMATQILTNCSDCLSPGLQVENRILLITDAQPNTGDISQAGLGKMIRDNASKNIFLTLIGVGLDLNTELVESLATTRGANYFSVHSPGEFEKRLVEEFDFAVTPLVFDLKLSIDSSSIDTASGNNGSKDNSISSSTTKSGWQILSTYGTQNPTDLAYTAWGSTTDESTTILEVNTLFPSAQTEEGIKGGVILLRLAPPDGTTSSTTNFKPVPLILDASYTDRTGKRYSSKLQVDALSTSAYQARSTTGGRQYFQSRGVRKAVLLARYTDLLRAWLIDEWRKLGDDTDDNKRRAVLPADLCRVFPSRYCPELYNGGGETDPYQVTSLGGSSGCELQRWITPQGCILPTPVPVIIELGQWERQSVDLINHVPGNARQALEEFLPYMESEIEALGDESLKQEVDIIKKILDAAV